MTEVKRLVPEVIGDAKWVRVCAVDEVPDGEVFVLPLPVPIAVFNVDGEYFATDDTCTHAESSLADGYIDGSVVECAFHFAKFDIKTGAPLTQPACIALRTYETDVIDGEIFVKVPSSRM
jgi:3-phenylpropionate/trans-cinnamate dioxygenase ferredoxin component